MINMRKRKKLKHWIFYISLNTNDCWHIVTKDWKNRYIKKDDIVLLSTYTKHILIYTRIIERIHSHSGQSKRGELWDAWWTDSRRSSSQSGQLRYGSLWNSQWQPAHRKKSSLCSMIWQDRHITLHGSGGGSVVGRGAFSEDKGLGSDSGDGGDSGTPPGCFPGTTAEKLPSRPTA